MTDSVQLIGKMQGIISTPGFDGKTTEESNENSVFNEKTLDEERSILNAPKGYEFAFEPNAPSEVSLEDIDFDKIFDLVKSIPLDEIASKRSSSSDNTKETDSNSEKLENEKESKTEEEQKTDQTESQNRNEQKPERSYTEREPFKLPSLEDIARGTVDAIKNGLDATLDIFFTE